MKDIFGVVVDQDRQIELREKLTTKLDEQWAGRREREKDEETDLLHKSHIEKTIGFVFDG